MRQPDQSRQTRNLSILLEVSNALASQVRLDELLATIISKTAAVLRDPFAVLMQLAIRRRGISLSANYRAISHSGRNRPLLF